MARQSSRNFDLSLQELGLSISEAAKKALFDGAQTLADNARSRITPGGTGMLAHTITIKRMNNGARIIVSSEAVKRGVRYGWVLEGRRNSKFKFLYPAYDATKATIRASIITAIKEAIRKNDKS